MKKQTLPKLKKKAQLVFNAYIRKRDEGKPCITCGQFKELQAGHYFAVSTHEGLRYDEFNTNGECPYDNCFNESHLIAYGKNLIERIGQDAYHLLCLRAADYKQNGYKFSRGEVEGIIELYTQKIKEL